MIKSTTKFDYEPRKRAPCIGTPTTKEKDD
jgi:hypothetical protein